MRRLSIIVLVAAVVLTLVVSVSLANRSDEISAEDFGRQKFDRSTTVSNKWLPMRPGTQLVFEGTTVREKEKIPHRLVFTITDLTKTIAGVESIVLWDRDFSAGELVEKELAFFAQDNDGNVWQTGEHPEEYEDGKFVRSPTWIHGLKGARAGLTMKAKPRLGAPSYSLGWGPAVGFNDRAKVLSLGLKTCVPVRCYSNGLLVEEFNPDEPGKSQLKYYVRGVGNVRVDWWALGAKDDSKESLVLTKVVRMSDAALANARSEALKLEKHAYKISKNVYGRTAPMKRLAR